MEKITISINNWLEKRQKRIEKAVESAYHFMLSEKEEEKLAKEIEQRHKAKAWDELQRMIRE